MWGLTIFPVFFNSEVIKKSIIFLTDAKKTGNFNRCWKFELV